jgi:hypothetical protein
LTLLGGQGVVGSCNGLRCLIGSGFQGCMSIPAGPVGGVELGSGESPVDLIAAAGLATDAPDEGSGSAR